MAELIGAFVGLIVAGVELAANLIGLILELLVSGGVYLAEKPEAGESRFSGKRLLVAFAPVAFVVVTLERIQVKCSGSRNGECSCGIRWE